MEHIFIESSSSRHIAYGNFEPANCVIILCHVNNSPCGVLCNTVFSLVIALQASILWTVYRFIKLKAANKFLNDYHS